MTFRGKGGYIETRQMHSEIIKCFKAYSKAYKHRHSLFATKDKPTSKRLLQMLISKFLDELKINGKSAHSFRHSSIGVLSRNGFTIERLKYHSRHNSIQALASYSNEIEAEICHAEIEKVLTDTLV